MNYFGYKKYIFQSKVPLMVTVTVILSACCPLGPLRNKNGRYQDFLLVEWGAGIFLMGTLSTLPD